MRIVSVAGSLLGCLTSLTLAACSPGQLAQVQGEAYQLSIVDGAGYIRENHEWRRALRAKNREIVTAVIDSCIKAAREAEFDSDLETALERVTWCQAYIKKNYPDLVTIEAVREGKALVNELGHDDSEEVLPDAPVQ